VLYISLACSFIMLTITCGLVWWRRHELWYSQIAWLFLLFPCIGVLAMPYYLLNVALVAAGGLLGALASWRPGLFYRWTLLATLLTYGIASYFASEYLATLYPYESLEERLSYESRRDELPRRLGLISPEVQAPTFDALRLDDVENAIERRHQGERYGPGILSIGEMRTDALRQLHEDQVMVFVNSPSFGVRRMSSFESLARPGKQVVIPMASLATAEPSVIHDREIPSYTKYMRELKWSLHRESVADFLDSRRYGYVKDRRHVAGFQAHQFCKPPAFSRYAHTAPEYQLKRLELVSLLNHEQPGVYMTENLPRMDELRDVPIRALDDFERDNLKRLWHGDDLAVKQNGKGLRMLGALRAGKQCLSCHDAQRGDLLGAFSYHLDPVR
jgi:hypothetical protein